MSKQPSKQSSDPQQAQQPAQAAPQAQAPTNPLAEFSKLIAGDQEDASQQQEEPKAQEPTGKKAKPKDFAELASALGVDAKELYAITVPSARDGAEPYTLGKLKDLAEEHDAFTLNTLKFEDASRKRSAEIMRAEQELAEIIAALPPNAIKPELRQQLQAKRNAKLVAERQRVLDVIPEWSDQTVRTSELESMVEHLKDYGFSDDYLTTVFDHRTLRYIRENMRREKLIRTALERVTEQKPANPGKSKQANAPAKKGNGAQPRTRDQAQQQKFSSTLFRS